MKVSENLQDKCVKKGTRYFMKQMRKCMKGNVQKLVAWHTAAPLSGVRKEEKLKPYSSPANLHQSESRQTSRPWQGCGWEETQGPEQEDTVHHHRWDWWLWHCQISSWPEEAAPSSQTFIEFQCSKQYCPSSYIIKDHLVLHKLSVRLRPSSGQK